MQRKGHRRRAPGGTTKKRGKKRKQRPKTFCRRGEGGGEAEKRGNVLTDCGLVVRLQWQAKACTRSERLIAVLRRPSKKFGVVLLERGA